ncbi:MAG: hypothetical protein SAJ12_14285, partial [Jaaginema sp. PMC 1079.18]|nr:hypothetical protein [Jaaginema sp. PMC 1079.18]
MHSGRSHCHTRRGDRFVAKNSLMFKPTPQPSFSEILGVAIALLLLHGIMGLALMPLPHLDLITFGEPALLLATTGKIAAPGAQYLDLTYVLGSYFYPPGYIVILAAWLKVFGTGVGSWLGYTHVVHALYLLGLWLLLRCRLGCGFFIASLATLSGFPYFSYGRPDLTSLLFGVMAWLLLPDTLQWRRVGGVGILLGIAVLVSPPFGLSSSIAVGGFYLLRIGSRGKQQFLSFLGLAGIAIATFLGLWALILTWQDAWGFGLEQFRVHAANRGADLNTWPQPPLLYGIAFIGLPLLAFTLIPALVTSLQNPLAFRQIPGAIALSYLASISLWFSLSKSALLMSGYHLLLLARPVFHGVWVSSRQQLRLVAIAILIGFSTINFYFYKDDFLAFNSHPYTAYHTIAALNFPPNAIALIDSPFFPLLYRPGKTLNYFTTIQENAWQRYRNSTHPDVLAQLPQGAATQPPVAVVIVVSALTLSLNPLPNPDGHRPFLHSPP